VRLQLAVRLTIWPLGHKPGRQWISVAQTVGRPDRGDNGQNRRAKAEDDQERNPCQDEHQATQGLKVLQADDFGMNDPNQFPTGRARDTACAGIAAGNLGTDGDYIGVVAHDAKLYALRITFGNYEEAEM
jgi:hypothetical protein